MADHASKPAAGAAGIADSRDAQRRKPYERPRILSREPLEAMAATCTGAKAKSVAGVGSCRSPNIRS
jgi:hypothetical protein